MMSKAKLKAGDRVRVTHTDYPDRIPVGVVATVDTPDGDDAHLIYDGHSLYFFSSEFEVLPHFKVGDRVRLTKDNDGFGIAGDTGSVVVENGGADDCRVKFDRIIQGQYEWWVTWDGMEHIYTSCAAAEVDNLADEYGAPKAKFKVGDKIRHKSLGYEGVVKEVIGGDKYKTFWTEKGWGGTDPADDIELVTAPTTIADIVARHSQSGTAIVAVLESGQPRPATRPYVHGSVGDAETEANRLARANPGKEFGVYTLGSVAKVERVYEHEWQRLAANGETYAAKKKLEAVAGIDFYQAAKIVNDWRAAA